MSALGFVIGAVVAAGWVAAVLASLVVAFWMIKGGEE